MSSLLKNENVASLVGDRGAGNVMSSHKASMPDAAMPHKLRFGIAAN